MSSTIIATAAITVTAATSIIMSRFLLLRVYGRRGRPYFTTATDRWTVPVAVTTQWIMIAALTSTDLALTGRQWATAAAVAAGSLTLVAATTWLWAGRTHPEHAEASNVAYDRCRTAAAPSGQL